MNKRFIVGKTTYTVTVINKLRNQAVGIIYDSLVDLFGSFELNWDRKIERELVVHDVNSFLSMIERDNKIQSAKVTLTKHTGMGNYNLEVSFQIRNAVVFTKIIFDIETK